MDSGLRVELAVSGPGECPVTDASATVGEPVTSVARTSVTDDDGRVVEEFTVDGDGTPAPGDVTEVAAYEGSATYRFRRERGDTCVCETVERFGYPVSDVHAQNGTLHLSFHVPDVDAVGEVVTALRERFTGVSLRKLVRSDERSDAELVFVDRGRLTDRQRTVLKTAYEMGYFDHPKGANKGEVAAALDISPSTFSEHLAAAQGKLMEAVLSDTP